VSLLGEPALLSLLGEAALKEVSLLGESALKEVSVLLGEAALIVSLLGEAALTEIYSSAGTLTVVSLLGDSTTTLPTDVPALLGEVTLTRFSG